MQFHPPVRGLVGFHVSVKLVDGAEACIDVTELGMPLDFRKIIGRSPLRKNKPEHEQSKVSVRLEAPVLPESSRAEVLLKSPGLRGEGVRVVEQSMGEPLTQAALSIPAWVGPGLAIATIAPRHSLR